MAQIDIGKIKMVWKNAWNSGTAYTKDDAVSHSGSSYICIQDGTNQNPSTATAYWELLAQAGTNGTNGTNGTDVGTVITTQGDVLYRDGSGLQRLAKPASDMYLKNTSGGVLSWAAVSSDFVKLATGEVTSDASYMEVNGYFDDSVYHCYKIFIHGIRWQTGGGQVNWRWTTAAGTTDTSNDYVELDGSYHTTSNGSKGFQQRSYWNTNGLDDFEGTWSNSHSSASSTTSEFMEGTIYNPSSGYAQMAYQYNTLHDSNGSSVVLAVSNGFHGSLNSNAKTGFQLLKSSGTNIRTAKWAFYGIKK